MSPGRASSWGSIRDFRTSSGAQKYEFPKAERVTRKTIGGTEQLDDYIERVALRDTDVLSRLRRETERHPRGRMLSNPVQGQLMALLAKAIGARRALEVGTFTGYSALCVASALPPDGMLVACDIDVETTAIARRYWREAGVDERITLRIGAALDTLKALLNENGAGSFDFAFVDADKASYDAYYEYALQLVRRGGLILFDNVLRDGRVTDPNSDSDTLIMNVFNEKLGTDERIDVSLLPIADGVTICLKR
jgi:predicted O-methyltransferase YrrM